MKEHVEYKEEPLVISHYIVSFIFLFAGLALSIILMGFEVFPKSDWQENI